MKIEVVPYNSNWGNDYDIEKRHLTRLLNDPRLEFEHVGSTAVKGLEAQPVIDVMIGTPNLATLNGLVKHFSKDKAYIHCQYREETFPNQRYFIKIVPPNAGFFDQMPSTACNIEELPESILKYRKFQILALEKSSLIWENHLLFRRLLQKNPIVREQYGQLKSELASLDWPTYEGYITAKAEFIQGCLSGMRRS